MNALAPQPPFPDDLRVCRWCGAQRHELLPASGCLPPVYVCNSGCTHNSSAPYLGFCPTCRRNFQTGLKFSSLCYECDQKERTALTPDDDGSGAQTYNYRRAGRGGYRSGW